VANAATIEQLETNRLLPTDTFIQVPEPIAKFL
jgi:hypothetical protein